MLVSDGARLIDFRYLKYLISTLWGSASLQTSYSAPFRPPLEHIPLCSYPTLQELILLLNDLSMPGIKNHFVDILPYCIPLHLLDIIRFLIRATKYVCKAAKLHLQVLQKLRSLRILISYTRYSAR